MKGLFINSDAWNFWFTDPENMNVEWIQRDVDFYTQNGGVEVLAYNMNFQRIFFPSKSGKFTPIWKEVSVNEDGKAVYRDREVPDDYKFMAGNALKLHQTVPDFMEVRYRYCHEKGVEMWHSMRMNDIHHTPLESEHWPQHSDLWRERKDLIRAWYRHTWRGDWHDNGFDYAKKEIYDYHLSMAEEYLLNFESDGIELDFLRALPVFRPGFDELCKNVLTQFMRDVRYLANLAEKKFGHRLRIAVRVPYSVMDTMAVGMDVLTWAREKLVDIIIPGPNNTSTEDDCPVDLWKQLIPEPVQIVPCIDCTVCGSPGMTIRTTQESDNGFAATYYHGGADGIYLYNHFSNGGIVTSETVKHQEFNGYAANSTALEARKRRHIVTHHDCMAEGVYPASRYPSVIWPKCCNGTIRVNCGGRVQGRNAVVIVGCRDDFQVDVLVNTVYCRPLPPDYELPSLPENVHYLAFEIPIGTLHDGLNVVECFNRGDRDITGLCWTEIDLEAIN